MRYFAVIVLTVLLGGLLAIPAIWLGWPLVTDTLKAGGGADCPSCAIGEYLDFGPLAMFPDDRLFERTLCQQNRQALKVQAQRFAEEYKAAAAKWNVSPHLSYGAVDGDEPEHLGDGRATVIVPMTHSHEAMGGKVMSRKQVTWRFDVVNEDGWRVCAVEHPDGCRDLISCAGPSPVQSTEPLRKVWDTRVPYKCLPDKPYRDLEKGCGTPPADWVQPGPHYCAPDQPFGIPATRSQECAALGWY